ncbi:MAG: glycosyltransferase family 4 protein [bacterium JZ-2024 1]
MTTQNIILDVSPAGAETGIGRYTRGLATALLRSVPHGYRLILVSRRQASLAVFPTAHHLAASRLTFQVLGASLLKPWKPALYIGPDFTYPTGITTPTIVVAHDLIPWKHPEWVSHRARILYRVFGTPCLRNATVVLADSEFTAREFQEVFHRFPHVVYPGISEIFTPPATPPESEVRLPDGTILHPPYLLFVGALDARRNASLLFQAFKKARRSRGDLSLVMVGKLRGNDVRTSVHRLRQENAFFLGGLPDDSLVSLYHSASALVYLSSYEGFGYPPVEALACEKPVLVSDIPVFRETLEDFPTYVSLSAGVDALCRQILQILDSPPPAETLRRASQFVRSRFSWSNASTSVWKIISEVLS